MTTIGTTGRAAASGPASGDGAVLRVEGLSVHYRTPSGPVHAVEDVSFRLHPGERLALVGESGSGKTTLATALLRQTKPPGHIVGGRVLLDEQDLLGLTEKELRRMRLSKIALVPQGAMNSLNPVTRLQEQILDGIRTHDRRRSQKERADRVSELLRRVDLEPSVARLYPHELSGGMKQRAAMAIATSLDPLVIVADEPTSALDVVVQRQVMSTLGRLQEGLGAAVVLIGHDMGLVAQFADRIGVMYAGRLVEIAPVRDLFADPRHPYTRLLIDSLPSLEAKRALTGIPGLPPSLLHVPPGCAFHPRCPFRFDRCDHEVPDVRGASNGRDPRQVACHLYPDHDRLPPVPPDRVRPDLGAIEPMGEEPA